MEISWGYHGFFISLYLHIPAGYPTACRGELKTGIFQKRGGGGHTPRNISDENFWFTYGRIRQWKILALSFMHQGASVDVVRYVQSVWSVHFLFSLPKLCLWIFGGGGAKPWYFTALEAPPPTNSIVEVGFRFWVSSKTRSRSSHRSYAVCFFDLCISTWYILIYPG